MYLAALSPTIDGVRNQIAYLDEKENIELATFDDFFDTKQAVLRLQAKTKKVSIEELKAKLLIPAKEKAIRDLQEKYGFEIPNERQDPRKTLLAKYNSIKDKHTALTEKERDDMKRVNAVSQLLNVPDSKK